MHTLFAGWGACGPLNQAGVIDFAILGTIIWLIALGVSSLLLIPANKPSAKSFTPRGDPYTVYGVLHIICGGIRLIVLYTALVVLHEPLFGDNNLSPNFEEGVPCEPVTPDVFIQALAITALAIFMLYKQYRIAKAQHANRMGKPSQLVKPNR